MYVPLELLLGSIISDHDFSQAINSFVGECQSQHTVRDDVIKHYFHTRSFKTHPFFVKHPDALAIHLYIDAFKTTNPLGSHTGIHKVEGLYMLVQNMPSELQSKLSSIFLVALWHSKHVKSYGYDALLEPVVRSLQHLESDTDATVLRHHSANCKNFRFHC